MIPPFARSTLRSAKSRAVILTIVLIAALVSSRPHLVKAEAPATPAPFAVLKQAVKIKIKYGETVLPTGMKLQVVSSDAATVRVDFMGEIQTIPKDVVQIEAGPTEQRSAIPSPIPPTNPTPPRARSSGEQSTVSLAWGWDSRMQGGDITMRELQSLLSPHCTPDVDLGGYGINIYNGVRYLMNSNEAATVLGLRGGIPSRARLATPGFPRSTMNYIGYDGNFEGHFNRLYLVTDGASKVVSIQLVDEHPRSGWAPEGNWNTYNFINTRLRASPLVRVVDESRRQGDVIQIETRMYEPKKGGKSSGYQQMENTKLLIPVPFARIILHCTQIGLSSR
jgi:hypothetical protein